MIRYFIQLAYKGTNFHGWQIQENALSVQEELENALTLILKEKISVTGAGRTDTGVHANYFIAHFDTLKVNIETDKNIIYQLNQVIHKDIAIYRIFRVKENSHARFDAISREYKYYISRVKNPFKREYSHEFTGDLDVRLMIDSAKILFEYNDFKSFCKLHSDVKTTLCEIYKSCWEEENTDLIYTIKADRFLRNMVRAIVGTMFEIGRKKISLEGFHEIIRGKNRNMAGASAPAKGLFLTQIEYSKEIFNFN